MRLINYLLFNDNNVWQPKINFSTINHFFSDFIFNNKSSYFVSQSTNGPFGILHGLLVIHRPQFDNHLNWCRPIQLYFRTWIHPPCSWKANKERAEPASHCSAPSSKGIYSTVKTAQLSHPAVGWSFGGRLGKRFTAWSGSQVLQW